MKGTKLFTRNGIMENVEEENENITATNFKNNHNEEYSSSDIIGYGKFEFQNKIIYLGFYKQKPDGIKMRHGKGKIIHPTINVDVSLGQEIYEGDWVDDKMQGFGIYYYSNGDKWEPEIARNLEIITRDRY